ncbi:MAG: hypothetical protein MJ057_07905 [Sphaerochaetaceae bacterium]|nr:hypothetical protein [Sphaerochaetaceae bacterium]
MNFFRKTFIITLLVLLTVSAGLFAQSVVEKNGAVPEFSSLDFEKDPFKTIMKSYEAELVAYNANYETIYGKMSEAYRAGNAVAYYEAKGLLGNLKAPVFSKDATQVLVARIVEEKDEQVKSEFAAWLYANSRYYRPTVSISAKYSNNDKFSTYMSYQYSKSAAPGTTVKLPYAPSFRLGDGTFAGWGVTADEVLYEAGAEIVMPYADLALQPVFTTSEN